MEAYPNVPDDHAHRQHDDEGIRATRVPLQDDMQAQQPPSQDRWKSSDWSRKEPHTVPDDHISNTLVPALMARASRRADTDIRDNDA